MVYPCMWQAAPVLPRRLARFCGPSCCHRCVAPVLQHLRRPHITVLPHLCATALAALHFQYTLKPLLSVLRIECTSKSLPPQPFSAASQPLMHPTSTPPLTCNPSCPSSCATVYFKGHEGHGRCTGQDFLALFRSRMGLNLAAFCKSAALSHRRLTIHPTMTPAKLGCPRPPARNSSILAHARSVQFSSSTRGLRRVSDHLRTQCYITATDLGSQGAQVMHTHQAVGRVESKLAGTSRRGGAAAAAQSN